MAALTKIAEQYQSGFEVFEKGLNGDTKGPIHALRRNAFESFKNLDIPGAKTESYKYFNLRKIIEKEFDTLVSNPDPDGVEVSALDLPKLDAIRLVFINGIYKPELSDNSFPDGVEISSLKEFGESNPEMCSRHLGNLANFESDAYVALNTAFVAGGSVIRVKKNTTVGKPVMFIYLSDSGHGKVFSQPRNLIVVEENAECSLIEHHVTNGSEISLTNAVTEITCEENSRVNYYKIGTESASTYHVGTTHMHVATGSLVNSFTITMTGAMVRNNLNLDLNGENCEVHMYGLYLPDGKSVVDNNTSVDHKLPNSYSNELYKGIMSDGSTGTFNGRIYVREDAQKTNAFQSNKNIVLTDQATINTKPQLEIWADDVKCSHGCTNGQLEEEQLFYLRSRGLDINTAKAMLLYGFAAEVIEKIPLQPLREFLEDLVSDRLNQNGK